MSSRLLLAARLLLALAVALPLASPHVARAAEPALAPFGAVASPPQAPWHVVGLPQQTKPFTRFSVVDVDGKRAVKIEADESYGNLVHPLKANAPAHLAWQWRVEQPIEAADLRQKSGDDNAVKVCVFFDEPIGQLSFVERQALRYFRARSTEPIPAATLCYVWDTHLPPGTALDNPFTRRMRYFVLESGAAQLDRWVAERRDLAADFRRVFGSECPTVPPVVGVSIGADADNTHGHSVAYVGDLSLER